MNTLVATLSCESKGHAIEEWVAATAGYDRLVATESDALGWADFLYGFGLRVAFFDPPEVSGAKAIYHHSLFNSAWQAILDACEHEFILSLDSDVSPPKTVDLLALMEDEWDESYDFVAHGVPWRRPYNRHVEGREGRLYAYETSCTIARAETWRRALRIAKENRTTLYLTVRQQDKFRLKEILVTELTHHDSPDGVSP